MTCRQDILSRPPTLGSAAALVIIGCLAGVAHPAVAQEQIGGALPSLSGTSGSAATADPQAPATAGSLTPALSASPSAPAASHPAAAAAAAAAAPAATAAAPADGSR